MSLPLLRLQQGAEDIDTTGLKSLDPDTSRVLLHHLFGPGIIQIIVTRIGDLGNDGAEGGEATAPELSTATSLYVPLNAEGPDRWLVDAFPSSPETDGTTVMIDVEYYREQQDRYGAGGNLNPIVIPDDEVLDLPEYQAVRYDASGTIRLTVGLRDEYRRWFDWTQRLLSPHHQKSTGIVTQMPPFHRIVRVLVLRFSHFL